MTTHFEPHKGHRLTNRFSAPWCDTCALPIFHAADWCEECYGAGVKRRMANTQHGYPKGKRYNCGKCKGTGVCKPIPCNYCETVGEIVVTQIAWGTKPVPTCRDCYFNEIEKASLENPHHQILSDLLEKLKAQKENNVTQ